jgi:rhamnosyltransferase subunit B
VVPHAHDQPDNAFRIANLGVSRTVFPRQYKAPRVARELGRILNDVQYRERSAETAAVVTREGGAEAAAGAIEQLLA